MRISGRGTIELNALLLNGDDVRVWRQPILTGLQQQIIAEITLYSSTFATFW